ncbi:hypothetical protein BDW02DRAFT_83026 [Decorospora gaudefroyi]|uniref:Uncharacterized protein n=1 Tax=Decorospora gaudefroyi TaxID=184978 RepID=A0A6A5KHT7_9PLEO|nr:hypothetical protein BDW02DRAFT_83026 [Decorospora gaudefroyi]
MATPEPTTVLLKDSASWPFWYAQLKVQAKERGIWDEINPEGADATPIHAQEPTIPTKGTPPSRAPSNDLPADAAAAQISNNAAAREIYAREIRAVDQQYIERIQEYKLSSANHSAKAAKLQNISTWINSTVSKEIMGPIMILLSVSQPTVQNKLRLLKDDLAPIDSNGYGSYLS